MQVVDREKLATLAATRPSLPRDERRGFDPGRNGLKGDDLEEWIDHHNVPVRREGSWQGGYRWVLEECPWNAHTDNSAYIVQLANGAIAAGCHHDSCEDYGWRDLREHYEPGAYEGDGRGEYERHGVTAPIGGRDRDDAPCGRPLTLKTFAEIPDPGAREFDVEKILPKGYALLLYGDGGTAKSLLTMSMLQAISRGAEEWLGLEVGRKVACLFVDFELDEREQRRRAFEVAAGDGLSAPPSNLYYLSAVGHHPKEVFSYARSVCEERGIGVVAIDSVGLALEGDPGSARDVVGFFRELDAFRASGITLILVDHQAKLQAGESYQGKLQYGSSYKGNLSRSRVQVELKKKGANVRSLILRQNKANFSDLAEPFGVKVVFEPGKIFVSREELDAADLSEERILNTSDRVLLALSDGPAFPNGFYSQSVWGVEFSTVKNNITKLRKDGLVQDTGEIEGQAREIELTEAGRKYVEDYLCHHATVKRHGVMPPIGDRDRDDAFEDNGSGNTGREVSEGHNHRPGERCIHDVPGGCWMCKRKTSEDSESSDEGNIERALYSRDGQALLYKTINGSYYLTGATQTTETTPLGIYNDSGGFDRTNSKIAFQFGNGVTIYDAQAKETQELSQIGSGGSISAPTFLHNSEELIYLWDPLNAKEGTTTRVYVASADGEVEEQVVDSQSLGRFFDYPVISYDDRYVLVEPPPSLPILGLTITTATGSPRTLA